MEVSPIQIFHIYLYFKDQAGGIHDSVSQIEKQLLNKLRNKLKSIQFQ